MLQRLVSGLTKSNPRVAATRDGIVQLFTADGGISGREGVSLIRRKLILFTGPVKGKCKGFVARIIPFRWVGNFVRTRLRTASPKSLLGTPSSSSTPLFFFLSFRQRRQQIFVVSTLFLILNATDQSIVTGV